MSAVDSVFDLVVFSAYGRGNWIATDLASRGWKVSLIDVTAQLGSVAWEDAEGPFGLLESQDLLPSQRKRLADEGELVTVTGGFTLWLEEGPLEFRSEVTDFLLRGRSISSEAETYLRNVTEAPRTSERDRRANSHLMYARNWLGQFAHVFASRHHSENHVGLESGEPSPLFAPFSIRRLTAEGHAKGLKAAQAAGVTVRSNAKILEMKMGEKGLAEGADIQFDGGGGLESGRAFVNTLSFDETLLLGGGLGLFPRGAPQAVWTWERVRFELEAPAAIKTALPQWFVALDDVDLAWTRANLMVVRRTPTAKALDVWVKVPVWMRHELPAFAAVVRDVAAFLERRLPLAKLGEPSLERPRIVWPVYEDEASVVQPLEAKNFFFSAPGIWKSMDWLGRFRHETDIVSKLEKMKAQWDAAARKLAERSARA